MAAEDVQVVRDAWTAWLRDGPEAIVPFFDPDIKWTPAEGEPDSGTHRGLREVMDLLGGWLEAFAEFTAKPLEFSETGDRVVVSLLYRARAHGGDAIMEIPEVHVVALRDGKVVEVRAYRTLEQARRRAESSPG